MRLGFAYVGDVAAPRLIADLGDDHKLDLAAAATCVDDTDAGQILTNDPNDHSWLTNAGRGHLARLLARYTDIAQSDPAWLAPHTVRRAPPVLKPGKFIAVGRNYSDHLQESKAVWADSGREVQRPAFPTAFTKYTTSLCGDGDAVIIPPGIDRVDYEIELCVVIGDRAHNVAVEKALDYVAGYTICNDIGARRIQRAEMEQQVGIVMAKNFPTFAPLGPSMVTADEIPDPQTLDLTLTVNGDVRQSANTRHMIFGVAEVVAYFSKLVLEPGDLITTGTPAGVALARPDPERYYLKVGDRMSATIDRVGTLSNTIRDE